MTDINYIEYPYHTPIKEFNMDSLRIDVSIKITKNVWCFYYVYDEQKYIECGTFDNIEANMKKLCDKYKDTNNDYNICICVEYCTTDQITNKSKSRMMSYIKQQFKRKVIDHGGCI
jgi:hypothetical protein